MDTKKLRQKILDLAIRGKLVPQDPNDEPASVLLERIRAEKQQLINEGKIKAPRSSKASDTSHYGNDVPFEVPEGWVWSTLQDHISVKSGINIKVRNCINDGIYPIYGGNGINGYFDDYNVEANTIIIGRVGFYCGSVHKTNSKAWVTDNALIVKKGSAYTTDFLYYLLCYLDLGKTSNSTAQPVVSSKGILPLTVPVPPIKEQSRIVEEIKSCFSIINNIEFNKDILHTSLQKTKAKILDLALSGKLVHQDPSDEPAINLLRRINPDFVPYDNSHYPFEIPLSWVFASGKDLFVPMRACKPTGEEFLYIDIDSVDNKNNVITSPKRLRTENAPSRASRFTQKGDVVFSMVRPYLKNIAVVPENHCIASTGFYVCSPKVNICSDYLYYMMLSPYVVDGLNLFMKGDNSPSINTNNILQWKYPVPPLNEQKRIIEKIKRLFSYLDKAESLVST